MVELLEAGLFWTGYSCDKMDVVGEEAHASMEVIAIDVYTAT